MNWFKVEAIVWIALKFFAYVVGIAAGLRYIEVIQMTAGQKERELLLEMALRPHGMIIRGEDQRQLLLSMLQAGWVKCISEVPGGLFACLTRAGKEAARAG